MKVHFSSEQKGYGLSKDDPILLRGVPASYEYLHKLMTLDPDLSFRRLGSLRATTSYKLIDSYQILYKEEDFCKLYINAYHHESREEVPQCFRDHFKLTRNPFEKYPLIEKFFHDRDEYLEFLSNGMGMVKANESATCMAELKLVEDHFLYKLIWLADGRMVGDFVKAFPATEENLTKFNRGTKIIADRLRIYLETDNHNLVPKDPPAFGDLTYDEKETIKFDYSNGSESAVDLYMRNRETGEKELVRIPKRPIRQAVNTKYHEGYLE